MQVTFDVEKMLYAVAFLAAMFGGYVRFMVGRSEDRMKALIHEQSTANTHLIELLKNNVEEMEQRVLLVTKHLEERSEELKDTIVHLTEKTDDAEKSAEASVAASKLAIKTNEQVQKTLLQMSKYLKITDKSGDQP